MEHGNNFARSSHHHNVPITCALFLKTIYTVGYEILKVTIILLVQYISEHGAAWYNLFYITYLLFVFIRTFFWFWSWFRTYLHCTLKLTLFSAHECLTVRSIKKTLFLLGHFDNSLQSIQSRL